MPPKLDTTENPEDDAITPEDGATGGDESTPADEAATDADASAAGGEGDGGAAGDKGEAGEVVISLGEEQPSTEEDSKAAPAWLKELRKTNREMVRALREKDAELARLRGGGQQQEAVLGPKPTLAGCDFDEDKFAAELEAWTTKKAEADAAQRRQQETKQQQQAAWDKKLKAHKEAGAKLAVPDFDDAEGAVEDSFSTVQRAILIDCAKDSAALMYALGKNPDKLKELAAIENPAHFTWALGQLETKLKIEPRGKRPPTPDRQVRGSGTLAATTDATLERLQAEADRTGDRTKVAKYLRDKKQQVAA